MNASSEIDYEVIFNYTPIGMCISRHRVMQTCNLELSNIFGYQSGELNGHSFQVLYPTQDEFERTGARIVPIMCAEKGAYSDEHIMRRANGDLFCGATLLVTHWPLRTRTPPGFGPLKI